MPRRDVPLAAGEYYHVYNRGNNRGALFFEQGNYAYFLRKIRRYVVPEHGLLVAYVLMPNHYHLLLRARSAGLSHAMQRLGISYAKSVNNRYGRTGGIFDGAFKAKHVDRDEYLLHLSRYIHLNPVRGGLVERAQDWPFSSYAEYVGLRNGTLPSADVVLAALVEERLVKTQDFRSPFRTSEVLASLRCEARTRYKAFVEAYRPGDRAAHRATSASLDLNQANPERFAWAGG